VGKLPKLRNRQTEYSTVLTQAGYNEKSYTELYATVGVVNQGQEWPSRCVHTKCASNGGFGVLAHTAHPSFSRVTQGTKWAPKFKPKFVRMRSHKGVE